MNTHISLPINMDIMLWETEKELFNAKSQLIEKDKIIQDLHDELYVSDLEVKELRQIFEKAHNVSFMHQMLTKIDELRSELAMQKLEMHDMKQIIEQSSDAQYLQQLNDKNEKLIKINTHLMESIYKSKVIYM